MNARLFSGLFAVSGPLAGKLAKLASLRGQFDLIGDQNRQPLLDREVTGAAGTDEAVLMPGEGRFAGRIEGATKLCEEGFVHGRRSRVSVISGQSKKRNLN